MLRAAFCDDQPEDLKKLSAALREYLEERGIPAEIEEFLHPDELLSACEKNPFHLYLLDVVMPMVSGIQAGRELRRFDREAQIVFITCEPGFALDSFSANPVNYLLKPLDKDTLFDTLTLALSKIGLAEKRTVAVKTKEGYRTLSLSSILCCEYAGHRALYTLLSGEKVLTATLPCSFAGHIAPLLARGRIVQTHAAFAVNAAHIEHLGRTEARLRGGVSVPVSRSQYPAVREAYLSLRLEGRHD